MARRGSSDSKPEFCRDGALVDRLSTLERVSPLSWSTETASLKDEPFEGLRATERDSYDGRLSKASFIPELLRGLEKLNDGRGSASLTESSDMAEGEREQGSACGLSGEWGLDMAPVLDDFLTPSNPVILPLSSSALSMTDLMLATLRADLGCSGDTGGASPRWYGFERLDSFVKVRGCDDPIESILLVRLGRAGDMPSPLLSCESNGSGDEERGTWMPK